MKPDETEKSLEEGITTLEHKLLETSNSRAGLVDSTIAYLKAMLDGCDGEDPRKDARRLLVGSGLLLVALDRANDVMKALEAAQAD